MCKLKMYSLAFGFLILQVHINSKADEQESMWGRVLSTWGVKFPNEDRYSAKLILLSGGSYQKIKENEISFGYYTEGRYRCEIGGIAKKEINSSLDTYTYKNNKEYWPGGKNNESTGFPEINGNCEVKFAFTSEEVTITTKGNCRSFCGAGGGLEGTIKKISPVP